MSRAKTLPRSACSMALVHHQQQLPTNHIQGKNNTEVNMLSQLNPQLFRLIDHMYVWPPYNWPICEQHQCHVSTRLQISVSRGQRFSSNWLGPGDELRQHPIPSHPPSLCHIGQVSPGSYSFWECPGHVRCKSPTFRGPSARTSTQPQMENICMENIWSDKLTSSGWHHPLCHSYVQFALSKSSTTSLSHFMCTLFDQSQKLRSHYNSTLAACSTMYRALDLPDIKHSITHQDPCAHNYAMSIVCCTWGASVAQSWEHLTAMPAAGSFNPPLGGKRTKVSLASHFMSFIEQKQTNSDCRRNVPGVTSPTLNTNNFISFLHVAPLAQLYKRRCECHFYQWFK